MRRFNRFYTRQIGLLDEGLLNSEFTLTEVRILYELAHREGLRAVDITRALNIDRGTVFGETESTMGQAGEGVEVEQIDHVHVHVSDRDKAAAWYLRVLGLRREDRLAVWAVDPDGPLMLTSAAGQARITLFRKSSAGEGSAPGQTVAFRIGGAGFLAFLSALPQLQLADDNGRVIGQGDVVDHDLAWSVYFCDPDGNRIELTTYDYGYVAGRRGR